LAEPLYSERFERALVFAHRVHRDQRRKGSGIPYVSHLLAVCSLAIEAGADEDEAIAALLHDAAEDQGGRRTLEQIKTAFGARPASIVEELSDTFSAPKPPWRKRKEEHIAKLHTASESALLITACDKLHNARCILIDYRQHRGSLWNRFKGGRAGTLWYYRQVTDLLRSRSSGPVLDALEEAVSQMHGLGKGSEG